MGREKAAETPNLFDYATKELSQDAMICWLIKWAEHDGTNDDAELNRLGRLFVESLLNCRNREPRISLDRGVMVEILQQDNQIDVLARVNGKQVLLIEDKTATDPHSGQLERYRGAVLEAKTDLGHVAEADLFPIYLKTGNQSHAAELDIESQGYGVFDRSDFLDVLERYDGDNPIVVDFRRRLQAIENETQSFLDWQSSYSRGKWKWSAWEGLYRELERRLFEGSEPRWRGWHYVPNPAGGFLGFFWQPQEMPEGNDPSVYLQLEWERLCFKVGTNDASGERQNDLKWHWHQRIMAQKGAVRKPKVMRHGYTMTVAEHRADGQKGWLRFEQVKGKLDLDATVKVLREAERILVSAAR